MVIMWLDGGNHFAIHQINTMYTLNLHNVVYQLHFSKVGEKYFETRGDGFKIL